MDKEEYQLLMKQIRKLADQGKYAQAADIIEQINWKRVRSASSLCYVGSVLGKAGKYSAGKELLLRAYDRSPIGRNIIYELTMLCVEEKNLDEAEEYYKEYVQAAPKDSKAMELRYAIDSAKGAPVSELIEALENLKERDFSEKWAYELAECYHKAGRVGDCVSLCDDIILWFGEGKYVERALELKMQYQPLTGAQKRTYEDLLAKRDGFVRVTPTDIRSSGEILHNDVKIPTINTEVNRFSTINLQAEIAKNMQIIMDATERETVSLAMDDVHKLIETSHLPNMEDVETPQELFENIETDQEIDKDLTAKMQQIFSEENDGQLRMADGSEEEMLTKQITGQMSIDEVLAEWEKTAQATASILEEASQRKLESAKKRALAETGNLMEIIAEVDAIHAEHAAITAGEASEDLASDVRALLTPEEVVPEEPEEESMAFYAGIRSVADLPEEAEALLQEIAQKTGESTQNIIVEGTDDEALAAFTKELISKLQKNADGRSARVGKISGEKLNRKDIAAMVETLQGGYLVIEHAGDMATETAYRLNQALSKDEKGLVVLMEGTEIGLNNVAVECASLMQRFGMSIRVEAE